MVVIPGDTSAEVISGLIADEAAIGMVNSKTTAVRVIPAIGRKAGEVLDFGGLLGYGPIMPINSHDPSVFINRGGRQLVGVVHQHHAGVIQQGLRLSGGQQAVFCARNR